MKKEITVAVSVFFILFFIPAFFVIKEQNNLNKKNYITWKKVYKIDLTYEEWVNLKKSSLLPNNLAPVAPDL